MVYPEKTVSTLTYVGFWRRAAALVIDVVALFIPSLIVGLIAGAVLGSGNEAFVVGGIAGILLAGVYFVLMETSHNQGTLGKMVIRAKVTDENGRPITRDQAISRFIVKEIPSILSLVPIAAIAWLVFLLLTVWAVTVAKSERKQGPHDMFARTLVIDK